jgi:membrane associated rhomboid family serine protease
VPYCYRHPNRETFVSCSECGRPICAECMTPAPVGQRCPEHSGRAQGVRRVSSGVRRGTFEGVGAICTKTLVAINVLIYLITAAQGGGLNAPGGSLFNKFVLVGSNSRLGLFAPNDLAHDHEWWRLMTSMFLHASVVHIAFNMFALYVIGTPVEQYLGRARYLGLYFVSGLAGGAGAVVQAPFQPVVGASGAIFGILGAMLIIEWQATGRLAGNAATWIVINLVISFAIPNISWGGHVGGLIGGILITLAYAAWDERGRASRGGLGLGGVLGLIVVAVGSVALAYWRVRGYA